MDFSNSDRTDPQKKRILLVEDESIVALDIQNRLNSLGYEIVGHAVSGAEAIELARNLLPQLILMDIKLRGEMDGIDAAMIIHDTLSIPIVFLTAYSDQATLERAKITEPFGYLLKPFQKQDLLIAIEIGLYKHEMTRRLRESERWLDTTLKSVGEGLLALDDRNRIKFMNAAAESLTGWNSADAIGLPLIKVFAERNSEDRTSNRSLLERKDGRVVPIEKQINLIRDEKGTHQGTVVVFRDVTRQVAYEEELITAKYVAEVANKTKSDFIANMTHELRTPLNSIIGMAEIIKEWNMVGERKAFVEILHASAKSLLFLVNSILDFSKIEAGKMEVGDAVFNLHDTVGEAAENLGIQAGRKGLSLYVNIDDDVPVFVRGDQKLIDHVLINLLGNAVKFTERGEVEVSVAAEKEGENAGRISIKVRDTGIGIPKAKLDEIFEPFSQVDGALTRNFGGTGLGLAITRRIVRILDGTVTVTSVEGQGSVFTVSLPLVPAEGAGEANEGFSALRALVWMKSEKSRSILGRIVRGLGVEVAEFDPDGAPAVLPGGLRGTIVFLDPDTVQRFETLLLEGSAEGAGPVSAIIVAPIGYRYSPKPGTGSFLDPYVLHEPLWGGNIRRSLLAVTSRAGTKKAEPSASDERVLDCRSVAVEIENRYATGDLAGLEAYLQEIKSGSDMSLDGSFHETIFRLILSIRKRDEDKIRSLIEELKRNTL